jgi:hypothetical protein
MGRQRVLVPFRKEFLSIVWLCSVSAQKSVDFCADTGASPIFLDTLAPLFCNNLWGY